MKSHLNTIVLGICLLLVSFVPYSEAQNEHFQVMTFNLRYPAPSDGFNYWPNRKELAASMIRYHEADIIGVQEAFRSQLEDLMKLLPGYKWYGVCRTDGSVAPDPDGEFSAIIYREDRFEQLDGNTFWLSESPSKVGVAGWDAALPRVVTWAKFRDKNTQEFFFHFNTHFDHRGKTARTESAHLIRKQIVEIAGDSPVVLTGDFNAKPTDEPYQVLTSKDHSGHLEDALYISQTPHHGPMSTWSGFQFPGVPDRRIDYIFIRNNFQVLKHANLADSWGGRFPSDHLPVLVKLIIRGEE